MKESVVTYQRRTEKIPVVVGATGTVGKQLTLQIAKSSDIGAVSRTEGNLNRLFQVNPRILPRTGDATDEHTMVELTRDAEWVAVVAADLSHEKHNPQTEAINRKIAQNTVEAARRNGFRVLYISSVGIFGDVKKDSPITESDSPNPQTSYGRSKKEGEEIIMASGVNYSIIRPDNILDYDADMWTHTILTAIQKGKINIGGKPIPISLIDLLGTHAEFGYVITRNLVDLILLAANNTTADREIFIAHDGSVNMSKLLTDHAEVVLEGRARSYPQMTKEPLLKIAQGIHWAIKRKVKVPYLDFLLESGPGYSGEHAKAVLGYDPHVTYDDYLVDAQEYVQTHGIKISSRI